VDPHDQLRVGAYFGHQIDALTEAQLTDYFTDLIGSHSWTTVKLDLYGLKFYYTHVLKKPRVAPDLIKPPKSQRLTDIVTVGEVQQIVAAGYEQSAVDQIVRLIRINEYKRRQGPFGPRITERAFGRDWRYPLSNGFRD
jgi:hypothetical protein